MSWHPIFLGSEPAIKHLETRLAEHLRWRRGFELVRDVNRVDEAVPECDIDKKYNVKDLLGHDDPRIPAATW